MPETLQTNNDADDRQKSNKRIVSAAIGGVTSILITHPLDTLRIRIQSGQIFTQKTTIRMLFKGFLPPALSIVPLSTVCFAGYEALKSEVKHITFSQDEYEDVCLRYFFCGSIASIPTTLISTPMERIKILLQLNASNQNPLGLIRSLVPHSGDQMSKSALIRNTIRSVFSGFTVTYLRDMIGCGVWFSIYELQKYRLIKQDPNTPTSSFLFCGALAGAASWTMILPLDAIKTRIQSSSTKNMTIAQALEEIGAEAITTERLRQTITMAKQQPSQKVILSPVVQTLAVTRGLYKGYTLALMRTVPANAISWFVLEYCYKLMTTTTSS